MLLFVGNFDNELAGGHFAVKEKKGPEGFRFGETQNFFNVSPASLCVPYTALWADMDSRENLRCAANFG